MKPLLRHQLDALAFLRRREGRGALFMDPGLGKTRIAFEVSRTAQRTLVLAPLNPLLFVWPAEHLKWAPDKTLRVVRGTPAERARILFDEKPDIAVMNYEMLRWLYEQIAARRRFPYDLCILDESTRVKNASSVTFNALRALLPVFDACVPMTGTPAENSLTDIWAQLYMVDQGEALGKRIGVFHERYCKFTMRENHATWTVKRAAQLRRDAAPLCIVRRSRDCIDMPPLVFRDVPFALSSKERKVYDEIKSTHVVNLPSQQMVLKNTGVTFDKLRQLTSGFVYDENRDAYWFGDSKAKALREAVEESAGRPMLVGYWYRGSRDAIARILGYDVPTIDRDTSVIRKTVLLDEWQQGKLPVLLGQIKTVALGLNMQSPDASVLFFDLPWSHGLYWQFIRRVWRQGQSTRVIVRRLIAYNSIDSYVARALESKQENEEDLFTTILNEELI